jgi:hypothetical protein
MTDLPTPLTSADCNLRDFSFMPLDVLRLRDSDLAGLSTGNEFRSAVLLWCASWHQVPAASLPDDDISLAKLAGFGFVVKEWKKVREGALRGWIKCSDGRLYHPVVSEKANEAWQGRLDYRDKKEADRLRKAAIRAAQKAQEDARMEQGNPQDTNNLSAGHNENVLRTNGEIPTENTLIGIVDRDRDSGQGKREGLEKQELPKFSASAELEKLGVDDQTAKDWIAHRKAKKAAVTQTVIDLTAREASKAGLSLQSALQMSCMRGWTGFKAEWTQNGQARDALPNGQAQLDAVNEQARQMLFGNPMEAIDVRT